MIVINTLKTANKGYIKAIIDHTGCVVESGSVEAGTLIDTGRIFLTVDELRSLHNIIETAIYGLENNITSK